MIELIFVRHGQTDWNVAGKLQGILDIPLNDTGIKEAEVLKEGFNLDIDAIISSPLKRASRTAEILNEKLRLNITFDDRIMERDFGQLAGEKACFVKTMENQESHGVEPLNSFRDKILDFLDSCKKLDSGRYLIATHGGVIITLLNTLSKGKIDWENTPIENCTLTSIKLDKEWGIDFYNQRNY